MEKITGHPYGDYLRDRIFKPLGMTRTHIINVADIIPNRASGYWFKDGRVRNGEYMGQAHLGGPDVGVLTTATDLAKWTIALNGTGPWTEASRNALWAPARLNDGRDAVGYPAAVGYGPPPGPATPDPEIAAKAPARQRAFYSAGRRRCSTSC